MNFSIRYIIPVFFLITGCVYSSTDKRLQQLANIVSTSPTEVLDSLNQIDPSSLSEENNCLYNFLTVKARDKANITHTSDSLICCVLDYYSKGQFNIPYAEVLYYAGRVYHDLNNDPMALAYLQQAQNNLTPNSDPQLRYNISSQMGESLYNLKLYAVATPFIEESLEIAKNINDTAHLAQDLQLLGNSYLRSHHYQSAKDAFAAALRHSQSHPDSFKAKASMYLATAMCRLGDVDSALYLIKGIPQRVDPHEQSSAFAHCAYIYDTAGLHGQAYHCAQRVLQSNDSVGKIHMYHLILSPEYRHKLPIDSCAKLIDQYLQLMADYFVNDQQQLAINQHALYNYQIHEKEKQDTKAANRHLRKWLIGGFILICLLCICILYLNVRYKSYVIKLHTALENVTQLEQILSSKYNISTGNKKPQTSSANDSILELRERLRTKLYAIYVSNANTQTVSPQLLRTRAYRTLQDYIDEEKEIRADDPLWEDLEHAIQSVSPTFKENLHVLLGGKLSSFDLHTALLIKCGIPPSQMATLLNRVKGTIVSRRESICQRVFDKKMGTKVIDGIILLL